MESHTHETNAQPDIKDEMTRGDAMGQLSPAPRVYRRNGVREYIVWQTRERRIDWFELLGDTYQPLPAGADNVIHSRAFPGLRVAVTALLDGDLATVLAKAHAGVHSPEHRAFVARLSR